MGKQIKIILAVLVAVLLLFSTDVTAAGSYPEPTAAFYVNDFANILDSRTEDEIAAMGRQLEDDTGAQVVLVTVDSLEGKDIKTYSIELATQWGIGQKDKDNGILILNSVSDRKVRIEVGYGLESAVGAIRANTIIDNVIIPNLKSGDYDGGLLKGYAEIAGRVAESYGAGTESYKAGNGDTSGWRSDSSWTQSSSGPPGKRSLGYSPFLIFLLLLLDGIFFRFRFTSMLLRIFFWSNIFRGGPGGWGGGGFGGGGGRGGSSGGGGSFGGGGSDGGY